MKNFIIGYGESLTTPVTIQGGGGEKNHPYTLEEGRRRFSSGLERALDSIKNKPSYEYANGEVVFEFILHPSYLAKSYYPTKLFKSYGIKDVGSKSILVKPDKWGKKKHPDEAIGACIYVSGSPHKYRELLKDVENNRLEKGVQKCIRTFEKVSEIPSISKIKHIDKVGDDLRLEVVLHGTSDEVPVLNDFLSFLKHINGSAEQNKVKTVGGITFIPVSIKRNLVDRVGDFSHVRALRSMPSLRLNKPKLMRKVISSSVTLPDPQKLDNDFSVCIFDGGIGENHRLTPWVKEILPIDVSSVSSEPSYLSHGSEVCSSYLFGNYENAHLGQPFTNVDIVRVLSGNEHDIDLYDVLTRIEDVLKQKKYKYINLSLGPNLAIDDDEVHVWTSVLDQYLSNGDCFATVAVGNDGDLPNGLSRVQPPSDMVNAIAVGACDSTSSEWERAPYSCIGPGRSPGIVKPDGLAFGGSTKQPFMVYSPLTDEIIETAGTSFASPLALRVAAGIDAITDFDLSVTTVKALMVHKAKKSKKQDIKEVGWGRFPTDPKEVIECLDDEATIIFQGELEKSKHIRVPIPLPQNINCTWVNIKATFCINAVTDPEHPLNYTRSGLEIVFRPNNGKYSFFDGKKSKHPSSSDFFKCNDLYQSEQELRDDAQKWETTLTRQKRFKATTLDNPMFDIKYHAREHGAETSETLPPLKYSLILTIQTVGDTNIYNNILQQNQTLQPVRLNTRIRLD